jgi:hypothetical protein
MIIDMNTIANKGRVIHQISVVVFICGIDKIHHIDWITKVQCTWIAILASASFSWESARETISTGFVVFAWIGNGNIVQAAIINNTGCCAIIVKTINEIARAV